jgi:uncharacterized protein (AIM24 family)
MHDQLVGATQPVLSISLDPGESIVAGAGGFAWMTESIGMSSGPEHLAPGSALHRTICESSLQLSVYTARETAGTIAFASKLPGSIVGIELTPGVEYLVHRRGFLACTPGIEISTGYQQPYAAAAADEEEFLLRRISGHGRAWVELSGDVVRRELAAGASLRTHPWHIGMSDGSVAVQIAEIRGIQAGDLERGDPGHDASRFAVLSGPGAVWLQSTSLLASPRTQLGQGRPAPARSPAPEGGAGARTKHSTRNRG